MLNHELLFFSGGLKYVSFILIGVCTSSWSLSKGQAAYHGWRRWNLSIFEIGFRYVDQRTVFLSIFSDFSTDLFISFIKQMTIFTSFSCQSWPNKSPIIQPELVWKFHSECSSTEIQASLILSFSVSKFWQIHNNQLIKGSIHVCSAMLLVWHF